MFFQNIRRGRGSCVGGMGILARVKGPQRRLTPWADVDFLRLFRDDVVLACNEFSNSSRQGHFIHRTSGPSVAVAGRGGDLKFRVLSF
ncbi:hypothetical protein AVEN_245472-1 [Araneus ventricosus]|uniref:Uncharacterized protein n=1 Tax=Araneus ventricosus TaxID=182803 RepID=A0A4Y2D5V6_ARAVE|nr:hypothetical protein AVEN_245472-1 [Araneus ventricosus]